MVAFSGAPVILRLCGHDRAIHPRDPEWSQLLIHFPTIAGSRQIFDLTVDHYLLTFISVQIMAVLALI